MKIKSSFSVILALNSSIKMGLVAEYVEKKPEMQMSQPMKMDDSKMMNMGK